MIPKLYTFNQLCKDGYSRSDIYKLKSKGYLKPFLLSGKKNNIAKYREIDFLNAIDKLRSEQFDFNDKFSKASKTYKHTNANTDISSMIKEYVNEINKENN